jgi:hypothetical protein
MISQDIWIKLLSVDKSKTPELFNILNQVACLFNFTGEFKIHSKEPFVV